MKYTPRLIENLQRLCRGESLPYSTLPHNLIAEMKGEGVIAIISNGSRRSIRVPNADAFRTFLGIHYEELRDLDSAHRMLFESRDRAEQARESGNSKLADKRSCPGILVNSYTAIECRLNGEPFIVAPQKGSAVYVSDWKTFAPPTSALIVGMENMENFFQIRRQETLIRSFMKSGEEEVLFVARYSLSNDLGEWLSLIPNRYLHFGDFDLAGVSIYMNQFLPHVGDRGEFLIPDDVEYRISRGSRKRYDDQYSEFSRLTSSDSRLSRLIAIIHQYRRGYDQEGYIEAIDE